MDDSILHISSEDLPHLRNKKAEIKEKKKNIKKKIRKIFISIWFSCCVIYVYFMFHFSPSLLPSKRQLCYDLEKYCEIHQNTQKTKLFHDFCENSS
jgi:hypothetical protein